MDSSTSVAPASPGPIEQVWRALNSLPVAVIVMVTLAVLSALGTVIPQEHLIQVAPGAARDAFYIDRFGEQRYHLISALGLNNIYFTWYFFLLLLWLCVSATICTLTRIKRTLADWRGPQPVRTEAYYTAGQRAGVVDHAPADAAARVVAELKRQHYRVFTVEQDGATHIYADKGFWKRWGLVVLHVSVLILLAGAMYGKSVGAEGSIRLADGEQATLSLNLAEHKHPLVQPLLKNLPPREYQLSQGSFRIDYDKKIMMEDMLKEHVPAELQDYYRYFVKDFVSTLTVTHAGQTKSQEVTVNHPLVIDKLNLYQSGYEQRGYLTVTQNGTEHQYPAPPGMLLALTSQGLADAMQVISSPDCSDQGFVFEQVKAGDLYVGGVKQGYIGPLTLATLYDLATGEATGQVLLTPAQGFTLHLGGQPVDVRMAPQVDNYSVFSYKRDPGIPVLYFGWIALILGIGAALYIPYGQLRARIGGGRAYLLAHGAAAKGEHPLDQRLRDMLSQR
jgi:cytochrome c biogenesis protein